MTKKPASPKSKKTASKSAGKMRKGKSATATATATGTDATLSVLDGTSKNLIRAAFLKRNY